MEKPTELNNHEISNVSGALWANALGAIAGGIGGLACLRECSQCLVGSVFFLFSVVMMLESVVGLIV